MKKNLFNWLILILVPALLAGCNGKDDGENGNGNGGPADFAVYEPEDLEDIDLDYDNPNKTLKFDWEAEDGVTYEWLVSLDEDIADPVRIKLDDSGKDALTHTELDQIMADLEIGEYKPAELFWVVEGVKDGKSSRTAVRSMQLWRFIKPFTDPRDGEIYRVCRVVNSLTGDYAIWMADNMRAKKYSDGTGLDLYNDVRFFENEDGATDQQREWNRLRGGLYTWTAVVRTVSQAEAGDRVQGIAPAGWHVATKADWDFLINSQPDSNNPNITLMDSNYWAAGNITGANTSKFNMVAAGYIWEPVGSANGILIADTYAFFWCSDAPKAGDVYPWSPDPAAFPDQGVTYGFNNGDPGGALYPYNRQRGFSVRCVLD